MAISLADNIKIQGKKQNVERDSFATLEEMKNYNPNYLPDIFTATCKETGKLYVYNVDNEEDATTGKWRVVEGAKVVVDQTYSATSENAQSGKAVASGIATELGKLTYLTKVIATKDEIDRYVADPTKAKFNVIYLLKDTSAKGSDKYFEYQRIGDETTSTFEITGDTSTDLSDYAKSADVVAKNQTVANKGKMLVVGSDGNVTTSNTVKGNFYVEDSTPEGDRSGLSIIPNGQKTTIHPTGDSTAIEIDDDLILAGTIKKGDTEVLTIGDKGHVYHKTGVDVGTADTPKPLNVHGTLNVDRHSIYCEGIKASDSIFCESYVKTENLMSASSTYLGNAKSSSDISFFCQNVRVVADKGKEAMQMDSPLALMSVQPIYVDGKYVNQAHLDMGYGGHGHISTERLDVKQLQSNSNGGIDVGTPMRFHSHIDCGEINIAGGFALTIKDEASHQNMKLTSDGSIFCGDIHCNYPIPSPYGEGTKHSGNAYGEHSIDGVGYFTARNITTYESITYRRGGSKRDWYLGWTAEIGTLSSSSLTLKQSLVLHRMLNLMLMKSGNVMCDSQTFVVEQFPAPSGGAVVLRTDTNTVINVGISINNSTINVSSLPSGYTIKVVGLS